MKQYITFEKEEFENNIQTIRYRMYFLDSHIRMMEEYGNGERMPFGIDGEYWKKNAKLIASDMRKNFNDMCESMKRFGMNVDFDFKNEDEIRRKIITEKSVG